MTYPGYVVKGPFLSPIFCGPQLMVGWNHDYF